MLKAAAGLVGVALVSLIATVGPQNGCHDATKSVTHLDYYPYRDMRNTVVLDPARGFLRDVDTSAVSTNGVERPLAGVDLTPEERDALAARFTNPVASDDSSIARGERKFRKTCVPCHGMELKGDGPVAALFMPPPDLLAQPTRDRKDGFIYSYIRHGGIVMPSYGAQVTAREAYDLINYLRHMQKTNPR
jgi:mono/diheme cytochrome c family protein